MKKLQSKYLVIDASVAMASGGKSACHPTAAITRDFLISVLTICHKAVMTPPVREEWDKHQSKFAKKWRSSMVAKKKLLLVDLAERQDIRNQVSSANVGQKKKDAMLKDCHLLESAIATDYRVISLDDTVRDLFINTLDVPDVRNVSWINPTSEPEQVIKWLQKGAPKQKKYQLAN